MIVCQCKGTDDSTVRKAVRAGATSIGEVEFLCGAGVECGGCHETIESIIREESARIKDEQDRKKSSRAPAG